MGRVSKYKKVKSSFAKHNSTVGDGSAGVWGFGNDGRKTKKRSLKAMALQKQKLNRRNKKNNKGECNMINDGSCGGFDLPPTGGDDFDLSDLIGSVRKQKLPNNDELLGKDDDKDKNTKNNKVATTNAASDEKVNRDGNNDAVDSNDSSIEDNQQLTIDNDDEILKEARMLKIKKEIASKKQREKILGSNKSLGRMEGESMKAYNKRVKNETRQLIKQEKVKEQQTNSSNKRQRKKEFLNKKKKKNKKKDNDNEDYGGSKDDDDYYADYLSKRKMNDNDGFITGEQAVAKTASSSPMTVSSRSRNGFVAFGEQVERPPEFKMLPRGANQKQQNSKGNKNKNNRRATMNNDQIEEEQKVMENMRRKVQAQYALIKAERKRNGDFHL